MTPFNRVAVSFQSGAARLSPSRHEHGVPGWNTPAGSTQGVLVILPPLSGKVTCRCIQNSECRLEVHFSANAFPPLTNQHRFFRGERRSRTLDPRIASLEIWMLDEPHQHFLQMLFEIPEVTSVTMMGCVFEARTECDEHIDRVEEGLRQHLNIQA